MRPAVVDSQGDLCMIMRDKSKPSKWWIAQVMGINNKHKDFGVSKWVVSGTTYRMKRNGEKSRLRIESLELLFKLPRLEEPVDIEMDLLEG